MATTFASYFRIFYIGPRSAYDVGTHLFLPRDCRFVVVVRGMEARVEEIESTWARMLTALTLTPDAQGQALLNILGYPLQMSATMHAIDDVPSALRQRVLSMVRLRTHGRVSHFRSTWSARHDQGHPARIVRGRELRASLAEHVRLAVQDHYDFDVDSLLDALREYYDFHGPNLALGADAISRACDALRVRGHVDVVVANCGHLELARQTHTIGGGRFDRETVCAACFDEDVRLCAEDGRYHWRENLYYWDSDDEYHLDEEPPEGEDEDEDEDDTVSSYDADARLDYSVNVMKFLSVDRSFTSSRNGDFHMGVELETVVRREQSYSQINELVRQTREILGDDYVVGKYDGSLGDQGIEFVTRPTSLTNHLNLWSAWCDSPVSKKLKAWDAGCCGMHVHIDSQAFTKASLGKFLQFFNRHDNADFIRGIAGRHPKYDGQAQSYAGWDVDPNVAEQVSPLPTLKAKALNTSRYRMVNCTNLSSRESLRLGLSGANERLSRSADTIEVRIFRASLRKDRLLAQLEFTHALVVFCRTASFRALASSDFLRWLRTSGARYRNLCKWFGITVVNPRPNQQSSEAADENVGEIPETIGVESLEAA